MQSEDSYLKRARTNEALLTLKYPKTCTDLQTSNLKPRLGSESNSRINFKSYCCCTRICTSFESQGDWRSPRTTANSNMFLLSHTHTHTHTLQEASEVPQRYEKIQQQQQDIKLCWSGLLCSSGWRGHHWNKQGGDGLPGDYNNTNCMN